MPYNVYNSTENEDLIDTYDEVLVEHGALICFMELGDQIVTGKRKEAIYAPGTWSQVQYVRPE